MDNEKLSRKSKATSLWRKYRLFAILCLVCIYLVHYFGTNAYRRWTINAIKEAGADDINSIRIYESDGLSMVTTIDDEEAIGRFIEASQDASPELLNHPVTTNEWHMEIEGERSIKLLCFKQFGKEDELWFTVIISGFEWAYAGSFVSKDLREWFDTYALGD